MQTDSLINHNGGYYGTNTLDLSNVLVDENYDYSDIVINFNKHRTYFIVKRILDIFLSFIALVVLSPIFLLTAIAIRMESKGKIIFTQMRTGKDGKVFKMYKFRSMCDGAEQLRSKLLNLNEMDGPVFKISNDPRVTKVGRFIRKTSIDELPQLINIIKGDMSIVGPRPLVTYETDQFSDYHNRRHMVRPGLTCYWQISGRNDISFNEWMALDLKYLEDISFWTDIKIILKTFKIVLTGKGAY